MSCPNDSEHTGNELLSFRVSLVPLGIAAATITVVGSGLTITYLCALRSTNIHPRFLINYLAGKGPHSIRGSNTVVRAELDPVPALSLDLTKTFSQALGIELCMLRTDRNWGNADVTLQLPHPISASRWYAYEQGTAQCSIARLIELGLLFNVPAPVLLGRTLRRLSGTNAALGIGGDSSMTSTARDSGLNVVVDGGRPSTPTSGGQA